MNMGVDALNVGASRLVCALVQTFWQGGAAILLVWAACRIGRGMSASLRCWLWRLACLEFALSLVCTDGVPLPVLPAGTLPAAASGSASLSPAVGFAVLWLVGVALGLGRMAGSWKRTHRLLRQCQPVTDPAPLSVYEDVRARFGGVRPVRLLHAEAVTTPFLVGVWRPTIVLPTRLMSASTPDQTAMIFAHELAHVTRRDLPWIWLPTLVRTLFFFQPLVRLACAEWQVNQEIACDALAIRVLQMRAADYGRMLLYQATWRGPGVPLFVSASLFDCAATLKRRIFALPTAAREPARWQKLGAALLVLVSLLALLPWRVEARAAAFVPCAHTLRPVPRSRALSASAGFPASAGNARALSASPVVPVPSALPR